jgi:hypothetical protein
LCADFLVNLDSKPNPQEGVCRQDRCKYALYRDIQRARSLAPPASLNGSPDTGVSCQRRIGEQHDELPRQRQ